MRFKKGSRVEVMKKRDMPIAWRNAEILSGNGHTYNVRYVYHPGMISESGVERVPRKSVRPCPPPTQGQVTWTVGDIVEVFEDFSWKIATILKVLQGDEYFVRVLGTSAELIIHKMNIRDRWLWQDEKWILMGKSSGACGVVRDNRLSTSNFKSKISFPVPHSKKRKQIEAYLDTPKDDVLQDSNKVSSWSLKRMSPYCSTIIESHTGNMQKIRVVEKVGRKQVVDLNLSVEKHLEFSLEDVVDLPSAFSWAKVGGMHTLLPAFSRTKVGGMHPLLPSSEMMLGIASLFLGIYSGTLRASTFLPMFMASPWDGIICGICASGLEEWHRPDQVLYIPQGG